MLFWIYLIYFVGILVCINLSTLLVAVMERNIVEVDDDKTLFLLASLFWPVIIPLALMFGIAFVFVYVVEHFIPFIEVISNKLWYSQLKFYKKLFKKRSDK